MRRVILILVIVLVMSALAVGVLALSSADITVVRTVISGGGQPGTGTGLALNGTLGEPIAGVLQVGDDHGLSSGFWQPGLATPTPTPTLTPTPTVTPTPDDIRVYLPINKRDD